MLSNLNTLTLSKKHDVSFCIIINASICNSLYLISSLNHIKWSLLTTSQVSTAHRIYSYNQIFFSFAMLTHLSECLYVLFLTFDVLVWQVNCDVFFRVLFFVLDLLWQMYSCATVGISFWKRLNKLPNNCPNECHKV